jgi:hypothetical protein
MAQKPIWEFDEKAALLGQQWLKQYERDRWRRRLRDRFVVNILVRLIILAVFAILSLCGVVSLASYRPCLPCRMINNGDDA